VSENLCIYHANCLDGFTAAWVVNKYFQGDCEFVAAGYGDMPPDVTDKDVYIVDFSYPREVIKDLIEKARTLVVLDHHKTAQEALAHLVTRSCGEYNNTTVIFDMERSGAMIAWNYFYPDEAPPFALECVQDRDLWKFEMKSTKAVTAYMFLSEHSFMRWNFFMDDNNFHFCRKSGEVLLQKHEKDVKDMTKLTQTTLGIGEFTVPCCNVIPTLASDVGHLLLELSPDALFSATFYFEKDCWKFSLRSSDEREDVSAIAKRYGGGGHRNAAGFKLHPSQICFKPDHSFILA
jgi:oligoribonuclease NrnB/cAMP/cGMP phosphodiesterase (DHH superfamily)